MREASSAGASASAPTSTLSLSYRRALSLHDLQDLSADEAAHKLGLPVGTIQSQIHRARRKLSEQVQRIGRVGAPY